MRRSEGAHRRKLWGEAREFGRGIKVWKVRPSDSQRCEEFPSVPSPSPAFEVENRLSRCSLFSDHSFLSPKSRPLRLPLPSSRNVQELRHSRLHRSLRTSHTRTMPQLRTAPLHGPWLGIVEVSTGTRKESEQCSHFSCRLLQLQLWLHPSRVWWKWCNSAVLVRRIRPVAEGPCCMGPQSIVSHQNIQTVIVSYQGTDPFKL